MYGINLEQYLETLETLPFEMRQKFLQMRDYDKKVMDTLRYLDQLSQNYTNEYNRLSSTEKTEKQKMMARRYKKCREWSNVKIQIATQTYEMVDKHIRKLDSELAKFEAKLKHKAAIIAAANTSSSNMTSTLSGFTGPQISEATGTPNRKLNVQFQLKEDVVDNRRSEGKKRGSKQYKFKKTLDEYEDDETPRMDVKGNNRTRTGTGSDRTTGEFKTNLTDNNLLLNFSNPGADPDNSPNTSDHLISSASSHAMPKFSAFSHPSHILDMPVDPNEPTYCVCHQVSYGEMIGCDNPDCLIEWFHFGCVNLTHKPKGKWYCPSCGPRFGHNKSGSVLKKQKI